jgi:spore maturation protein CgeB
MNISFFGSSLVSAYWNGAATYYRGLIRALDRRGHRITFYESDAYERQQHRDIDDPPWCRVVVYPATAEGVDGALAAARGSEVVVKASGVGEVDTILEEAVLKHKDDGACVVYWDVDAPATLDRMLADPDDPFRALVPEYALVFTYGGGDRVVQAYEQFGARACVPVYNAMDPDTHFPVAPDPRFEATLGLMANRLPDREERVHEFFVSAAARLPSTQFVLGGNGWNAEELPPNIRCAGHVYTCDHNAFNCSPLTVLNINRSSMAAYGHSPATRVFEAAGAGACLITDAWDGVESFLEPGREWLVAESGEAVAALVMDLTADEARGIGDAARARVLREHTYEQRAAVVDRALSEVGLCRL